MFLDFLIALFLFTQLKTPRAEAQQIVPTAIQIAVVSAPATTTPTIDQDAMPICNCWLEVKQIIPSLPNMKYLVPNSPARAGAVAIYNYHGVPHYAYVESVINDGVYGHWEKGSNLKHCQFYERFVTEDNRYLVGYWYPPTKFALL